MKDLTLFVQYFLFDPSTSLLILNERFDLIAKFIITFKIDSSFLSNEFSMK